MSTMTPKEKWTKRVKRWVADRVAKRKAKAKRSKVSKPKAERAPSITLKQLQEMYLKTPAPSYVPPRSSRGNAGGWADDAIAAYPRVMRKLKSQRRAKKFLAWCQRRGLSPSEGRELLNSRHAARQAA